MMKAAEREGFVRPHLLRVALDRQMLTLMERLQMRLRLAWLRE